MGAAGEPDKCKPNDQRQWHRDCGEKKRRISDECKRRNAPRIRRDVNFIKGWIMCGRQVYRWNEACKLSAIKAPAEYNDNGEIVNSLTALN